MGELVHAVNKHVRMIFRIFPKQINDAAIGAIRMIIRLRNFR